MAKKKIDKKKLVSTVEGDGAIEEVAPTVVPEPSTAQTDATAIPMPKAEQTPLSPYASKPVTINVGLAPVPYYVPWHLLKSTIWSTVPAGGEISLPTMSAETGHILVHYLYTGAYQTLKSETSGITPQPQPALKQALLVYRASVNHTLNGLEQLARQQIEEASASMDLNTFLDITRSEFPKKTEPSAWLQAYLKDKTQKAFEKDHTVFADDAFCASLCKQSKLNDYVMRQVVQLLSEKLTEALAGKGNIVDDMDELPRPQLAPEEIVADKDPFVGLSKGQREKLDTKMQAETLAEKGDITDELEEFPRPQPVPETAADIDPFADLSKGKRKKLKKRMEEEKARLDEGEAEVADIDPFAGLSKGHRKRLEKKMKEEKARLDEAEAEAAALAQYSYVGDDAPPATDVIEEPAPVEEPELWEASAPVEEPELWEASAPVEEPETGWETSAPALEPEAYHEVSMPEAEPEPCYEDSIEVLKPELQEDKSAAPGSPKSVWVEYVPPAPPKKETATAKKKRLAQEAKDKQKWDKEQQQNIDCEEKKPPCEDPEPLPEVPPELTPVEEPKAHVTSLCPERSVHILDAGLWKKCKPCRTMLRELASQIVYEEDM